MLFMKILCKICEAWIVTLWCRLLVLQYRSQVTFWSTPLNDLLSSRVVSTPSFAPSFTSLTSCSRSLATRDVIAHVCRGCLPAVLIEYEPHLFTHSSSASFGAVLCSVYLWLWDSKPGLHVTCVSYSGFVYIIFQCVCVCVCVCVRVCVCSFQAKVQQYATGRWPAVSSSNSSSLW